MKLIFEIACRFFWGQHKENKMVTHWFSLAGFILGVMSLVAAMGVVSGFEESLTQSISRLNGHLQIRKNFKNSTEFNEFLESIKKKHPSIKSGISTLWVEALAISKGKTQGVLLQGFELETVDSVLNLKEALSYDSKKGSLSEDEIWIGAGLSQKWQIKKGDSINIVIPIADELHPQKIKRSFKRFKVEGVLSLGKFEYDERVIVMNLSSLQSLAQVGEQLSGALLMSQNRRWAKEAASLIQNELDFSYRVQSWFDINSYLFEAIEIEKVIVFFVVLIILVASSFNAGISLWVGILQRTQEISLLRALGLKSSQVAYIMVFQGLFIAVIGSVLGIGLGVLLCYGLDAIQNYFNLLPGSVYKISKLVTVVRWTDLMLIFLSALALGVAATWWPARLVTKKAITEGLKYE